MYFVYRDGVYHDVTGESFRDFMEGKLPQFPGEYPTLDDWEQHLDVFPGGAPETIHGDARRGWGAVGKHLRAPRALGGSPVRRTGAGGCGGARRRLDERRARVPPQRGHEGGIADALQGRNGAGRGHRDGANLEGGTDASRRERGELRRRAHGDGCLGAIGADALLDDYVNKWGMDIDRIYKQLSF